MILGFLGSSWFCDRYNWNESVPVCQVWFMHIFIHAMSVVHWSQDASKCWASRYSKIFWAFLGGFWSHSICINLMVKSGEIGGMHPESQHGPARRCWRSTASHEGQSKNFKHHRTPQTQANDSKWWHAWSADVHRYTMIHKPYHNHPQWIHIISDFNPGKAEPEVHTWEKHGKTIYVFCLTGDDFFGTCGFAAMSTYHCSLQNFRSVMQLFKSLMVIMNQMVSIKTWKVMNIYASWIIILIIVRCCSIWSIFVVFPMQDLKARNNILLMRLEDVGGIQPFQRLRSPC